MRKGTIVYLKLKSDCVEKYRDYHDNVWPELEEAYRKAGITTISCAPNGPYLIVYEEYDEGTYEKARQSLDNDEIEIRWKSLMRELRDPDFQMQNFEEVYRLESN